jgi:long-chain fatty acid transport protein
MKKAVLLCCLLAVVALLPVAVQASGTAIYEQGSKASAQAGAFVARADDATALFYNPAGIAFLKGMHFSFNLTYINADVKYESPTLGSFTDSAKNFFIPGVYFTQTINDRIAWGFSVTAPYNLSTDWGANFPGRFVSRHSKIVTMDYHPVIAFKFDDNNALSIGLHYYDSKIELTRNQDTSALTTLNNYLIANFYPSPPYPAGTPVYAASEAYLSTDVRDQAFGWDIGYMHKADPWSFGLTYKSKASFTYTGHNYFYYNTQGMAALSSVAGELFPPQDVSIQLDSVPAVAAAGFAYHSNPWTVEFDLTWTQWSSWDKTLVYFNHPTSLPAMLGGTSVVPAAEPMDFEWSNTWAYRLGFGYKLNENWELRWGVLYDQAPVPSKTVSPVLPDADRWSVQFGTGYTKGKWGFDWYAMYLQFKDANINPDNIYRYNSSGLNDANNPLSPYPGPYPMTVDGKYKGSAILAGFQINYKF